MSLLFVRLRNSESAFTAAITFLAARAPFTTMPFGMVATSVSGAIKRGHYVLAVEDGRVVGLTCWALTDGPTAERWLAGEMEPDFDQTLNGDTVVLMLGGGEHGQVALGGIRHIGRLYPGRPYLMRRFGRKRTSRGRFPPQTARVEQA